MKLFLLILAALCLIIHFLIRIMHWPGGMYLIMASLLLFAMATFFDYQKRKSDDSVLDEDIKDDDTIDHV